MACLRPQGAGAAPAKINLCLHVTGRRPDGYHLLDSLVVFAGVHDVVTAAPADTLTLSIGGPFGAGLSAEPDNLVLRAARALAEAAAIEPLAALHLEKNLPVASGIGGGSADAAAALRVLSAFWNVDIGPDALHRVAMGLGADVPVCLASAPCRMSGIGERLGAAPRLPDFGIVLVNPGVGVATAAVFKARQGAFSGALDLTALPASWRDEWPDAAAVVGALGRFANDLEAPAMRLCPVVADVLDALRRAPAVRLARMSGSGATCFGLTATAAEAVQVARSVTDGQARNGPTSWWCWGGGLWPFTGNQPAPNDGSYWGVAKR